MSKKIFSQQFAKVKAQNKLALVPFLTAGFPDKKRFWSEIKAMDQNGATIIEIGVPFSDPVADGPVIEAASLKALEQGINLDYIFEGLSREKTFSASLVLMGYFNPFYQYGLEKLIQKCQQNNVQGLIIPDLPLEEAKRYFPAQDQVCYIPLIGLNTSPKRMQAYAELDPPFVYVVSVLGITGAQANIEELKTILTQAREIFSCPLVVGFGLSHPQQVEPIREYVDGVVFGTALIKFLNENKTSAQFLQKWQEA